MRADLRTIAEASAFDPRGALLERAGPLTDYEIFHNLVLVATYIEPPKIMKGPNGEAVPFHLTDRSLAENRFQGKCGLVLKCGPLAFKSTLLDFGGVTIERGDWVFYRPSDGIELFIKDHLADRDDDGLSCRLIVDQLIMGRVRDPILIY